MASPVAGFTGPDCPHTQVLTVHIYRLPHCRTHWFRISALSGSREPDNRQYGPSDYNRYDSNSYDCNIYDYYRNYSDRSDAYRHDSNRTDRNKFDCGRLDSNKYDSNKDIKTMKNKKSKHITLRLAPEEFAAITEKLPPHVSVSHYIRSALKEYSGSGAKRKLDLMKKLYDFYQSYQVELSHVSSNLNQAMKRENELAKAGILSPSSMKALAEKIQAASEALIGLKVKLEDVTTKIIAP